MSIPVYCNCYCLGFRESGPRMAKIKLNCHNFPKKCHTLSTVFWLEQHFHKPTQDNKRLMTGFVHMQCQWFCIHIHTPLINGTYDLCDLGLGQEVKYESNYMSSFYVDPQNYSLIRPNRTEWNPSSISNSLILMAHSTSYLYVGNY